VDLLSIYAILGTLGYSIAALSLFIRLFHPKGPNIILSVALGSFAIVMHILLLSSQMIEQSAVDFNLTNVISLVALLISICTTALAIKYKVNLLIPVVYGFSSVWLLIEYLAHPKAIMAITDDSLLIVSHITLSLIAYAVLIIATLYSFQVNYINNKLKSKSFQEMKHLPPLMMVEKQLFFILALGVLCLTLAEVTGFLFLENMFAKENIHKTVFSLIALATYIYTLKGQFSYGWRGKKVMILLVIASFFLTLAYFGSRFVKEFLLS
jgi:ABC-type uncharacterized transport system permease subunit